MAVVNVINLSQLLMVAGTSCSRLKHVCSLSLMSAGAPLLQLLVLKPDIRVRAFSVSDDISREKLRELLLHIRSSAMTHLVLMTSHNLAKLVLDQVTVLRK